MVANVEAMVRAGIEAYRGGKKAEARKLLEKAIELDDYNEQAWMWLSAVVETDEEKKTCLENVLVINPDNEEASRGLKMLGVEGGSSPEPAATDDEAPNPFTDTGMADFGDADFTADANTDDNWGGAPTATSSSSSVYQGPETEPHEYDQWVDGLNLGGEAAPRTPDPVVEQSTTSAQPDMTDMFGLDDDEDIFGTDDPFNSEPLFDDDIGASAYTSGPFGGSDDAFDLDSEPAASAPPPAAVQSPGAENISDSLFDDINSAEFSGGDFITGDDDFDNASQEDFTPDELFSFIPDSIRATRLPGTKKGVAPLSVLAVVVLLMLNVAALVFVISGVS